MFTIIVVSSSVNFYRFWNSSVSFMFEWVIIFPERAGAIFYLSLSPLSLLPSMTRPPKRVNWNWSNLGEIMRIRESADSQTEVEYVLPLRPCPHEWEPWQGTVQISAKNSPPQTKPKTVGRKIDFSQQGYPRFLVLWIYLYSVRNVALELSDFSKSGIVSQIFGLS